MTSTRSILIAFAATIVCLSQSASAGIILSLTSTPASPITLNVGDSFTVTVGATGAAGTNLSLLGVKTDFDSLLLSASGAAPVFESVGGIVPDGGAADFGTAVDPSDVIGLYNSVAGIPPGGPGANIPITADGAFYTFVLTAQAPGSGTVSFDLSSAFGFDTTPPLGNPVDVTDNLLPIHYTINANAVPEPSSFVIVMVGLAAFAGRRFRKRAPIMGCSSTT